MSMGKTRCSGMKKLSKPAASALCATVPYDRRLTPNVK